LKNYSENLIFEKFSFVINGPLPQSEDITSEKIWSPLGCIIFNASLVDPNNTLRRENLYD
jgi:hypothetical protein